MSVQENKRTHKEIFQDDQGKDFLTLPSLFLSKRAQEVIGGLFPDCAKEALDKICVTPCPDLAHGDFSCAAAFSLAKLCRKKPQELAEHIKNAWGDDPLIERIEIMGGYLNMTLKPHIWLEILRKILEKGHFFGHVLPQESSPKVLVEYVSANPTGPLHAAHARGAILGDVLAHLLQATGHQVTREYFINDAGQQVMTLARTVLLHLEAQEEGGTAVIPEGLYPGEYVADIALEISRQFPQWRALPLEKMAALASCMVMAGIQKDLEDLGIFMDIFTSEKLLQKAGKIEEALKKLESLDLVFRGTLPKPLGQEDSNWQACELLLFRATAFGDEQDCSLQRPDGSWTYFAGDLAYHGDKLDRGYEVLIDVWGADHGSHVQRVVSGVNGLKSWHNGQGGSWSKDLHHDNALEIFLFQMVHFYSQGKLLKMSKRSGTFITLRDVLNMIDKDALRFMILTKKADTHLELSIEAMKDQTKDNPVFYVQYAHARCCSALRALERHFSSQAVSLKTLSQQTFEGDLAQILKTSLVKSLADWPRQLKEAAEKREPHRITSYLHKVAQEFHSLWQQGNGDVRMRFVQPENKEASLAWGALVQATAFVLASGLNVLGVSAKEELRGEG